MVGSRFGELCCCSCLTLLPGFACSIHATWGPHFSRTLWKAQASKVTVAESDIFAWRIRMTLPLHKKGTVSSHLFVNFAWQQIRKVHKWNYKSRQKTPSIVNHRWLLDPPVCTCSSNDRRKMIKYVFCSFTLNWAWPVIEIDIIWIADVAMK